MGGPGSGPRSNSKGIEYYQAKESFVTMIDGEPIQVSAGDLVAVREALTGAGIDIESADVTQRPKSRVPLQESDASRLMKLIDMLEESDDVGAVHANFDVDADVLERIAS